jgi:hypothetical protein
MQKRCDLGGSAEKERILRGKEDQSTLHTHTHTHTHEYTQHNETHQELSEKEKEGEMEIQWRR